MKKWATEFSNWYTFVRTYCSCTMASQCTYPLWSHACTIISLDTYLVHICTRLDPKLFRLALCLVNPPTYVLACNWSTPSQKHVTKHFRVPRMAKKYMYCAQWQLNRIREVRQGQKVINEMITCLYKEIIPEASRLFHRWPCLGSCLEATWLALGGPFLSILA